MKKSGLDEVDSPLKVPLLQQHVHVGIKSVAREQNAERTTTTDLGVEAAAVVQGTRNLPMMPQRVRCIVIAAIVAANADIQWALKFSSRARSMLLVMTN